MRRFLSRWIECERKNSASAWIVRDADATAMCSHDLADDRQTESRTWCLRVLAAPEAFEQVLPILGSHAAAAIADFQTPIAMQADDDFRIGRRMRHGVLDQIADCIFDRMRIAFHAHALRGVGEGQCSPLCNGPWRHCGYYGGGSCA